MALASVGTVLLLGDFRCSTRGFVLVKVQLTDCIGGHILHFFLSLLCEDKSKQQLSHILSCLHEGREVISLTFCQSHQGASDMKCFSYRCRAKMSRGLGDTEVKMEFADVRVKDEKSGGEDGGATRRKEE
ncbi:hypothetical protein C0Q70_11924 [Pomacea canaliculata]|uniref:Uncharacterized protein n=1 Tax=Pomacea canaliculata TaxID=400727 RepID=A0A2T7P7F7_POMCA|nr:hypothetical protein C0Q70_11924 [Pomacea canaliculata]